MRIKRFNDISIKHKLTIVMMLTSGVALLLACGAFLGYEVLSFRRTAESDLATLAHIVGNNTAAAILFNDPKAAPETLDTLRNKSYIVCAHVYSQDGRLFSDYQRDGDRDLLPQSCPR